MQNQTRDLVPLFTAVGGLIVGVLFGWLVLGWLVFPVTYKDSDPTALRQDYKETYLALVADSYAIDQNAAVARQRLAGFTADELSTTFAKMKAERQRDKRDNEAVRIQRLADGIGIKVASVTPGPTAQEGGLPFGLIFGGLGVILILAGVGGLLVFARSRRAASGQLPVPVQSGLREAGQSAMTAEREEAAFKPVAESEAGEPTLGRFVTTYKIGDDGYDTSFSIETPNGEFLGECGVGISEVVGEGPQKVTAFEVWLFDKNDIKTVTKVLMSDFAYNDETIRKKLQARGDAVLAQRGREIALETEALRVNAVVADMAYGSGGTPQSFFSKLTMELTPTIKDQVPA